MIAQVLARLLPAATTLMVASATLRRGGHVDGAGFTFLIGLGAIFLVLGLLGLAIDPR